MQLQGRTVLVTGGAKRIGKSIACRFAEAGCDILLHYHHSEKEARLTQEVIQNMGVSCDILQADLAAAESIGRLFQNHSEKLSKVSILVNSASKFYKTPLRDAEPDHFRYFFDIHVTGPFLLSQRIGLLLKERKEEGLIINITDIATKYPSPDYAPYIASKQALESLTKSLALELAPAVRVNTVQPGVILFPENTSKEKETDIIKSIPLKRRGGPEDIAEACIFLAQSDYINGISLTVDGGRSLGQQGN